MIGAMEACAKPIIGAINGVAITGGCEIALACDVLVASREAHFADTHARVGILPGWGLSQKLPRLIGIVRAKELALTGNFLSAELAADWGLVNRVVEPAELLPTCRALAQDMMSCHAQTMRAYKALIDRGFGMTFADAIRLERETSLAHARHVHPGEIAARRSAIQERGRRQR
jgi:enoyl-CoA hydratase